MKLAPRTETRGGYVYRKYDNLLIGQIKKDRLGVAYGVSTRDKDLGPVYGSRMEIVVQLLTAADQRDAAERHTH